MRYIETKTTEGITTGQMIPETEEERAEMEQVRGWWQKNGCHCKHKKGEGVAVIFIDDGEDSEIPKHHWKCPRCGGVIQIG